MSDAIIFVEFVEPVGFIGGGEATPPGPEPAVETVYANPASSGGDGTTPALSGEHAAFSSLDAALQAADRDRVAAESTYRVICAGGADSPRARINDGWVTSPTYRLEIVVDPEWRMGGVWDADKYHLSAVDGNCMDNHASEGANYLVLVGLAAEMTRTSSGGSGSALDLRGPSGAGETIVDGVFTHVVCESGHTSTVRGMYIGHADREFDILNSITWAETADGSGVSAPRGVDTASSAGENSIRVLNHTSVGNRRGISADNVGLLLMNSVLKDNADAVTGTLHEDSDFNVSDDDDVSGPNSDQNQEVTFVDEAAGDFRLDPTDEWAIGKGTDLSALGFSHDAAGNPRTVPWDRGALAFVEDAE